MPRPTILKGVTYAHETASGRVHITVNCCDEKPYEIFVMLGKAGSEERALTEAIGRLLSTSLQSGVSLSKLYKQLRGISSETTYGFGPNKILSVADAVGISLKNHIGGQDGKEGDGKNNSVDGVGDQGTGRTVQVDGSRLRTA